MPRRRRREGLLVSEVGDNLSPNELVGIAWAHVDKAYKLLKRAAESDAVIVPRSELEAVQALAVGALEEASDTLAENVPTVTITALGEIGRTLAEILE